jgi:hypothetical protein
MKDMYSMGFESGVQTKRADEAAPTNTKSLSPRRRANSYVLGRRPHGRKFGVHCQQERRVHFDLCNASSG